MAEDPGSLRRRRGRVRRAGATDADRAARQREINRQLRVWTPRRIFGWILVGTAVLVGVVHWIAHLGYPVVPLSMGWQDLLIGYPAAALLGVVAAVILGHGRRHPAGSGTGSSRR